MVEKGIDTEILENKGRTAREVAIVYKKHFIADLIDKIKAKKENIENEVFFKSLTNSKEPIHFEKYENLNTLGELCSKSVSELKIISNEDVDTLKQDIEKKYQFLIQIYNLKDSVHQFEIISKPELLQIQEIFLEMMMVINKTLKK